MPLLGFISNLLPWTRTPPELRQVRLDLELAEARVKLQQIQRASESFTRSYGYGDMIDPREQSWWDERGEIMGYGLGQERQHGDFAPFITNEQDLAEIRGMAQWLAVSNTFAIGILENYVSFVVGPGYTYRVMSKAKADEELMAAVQDVIDEFIDLNEWNELEQELVLRSRRDGEYIVRYFPDERGRTQVRTVEPHELTEQGAPIELFEDRDAFRFGPKHLIEKDAETGIRYEDTQTILGYHIRYHADQAGEVVPPDYINHVKVNVDRSVKRGLSDFYATKESLDGVRKLLRNMREGEAVRAAIAGFWQYETASQAAVQAGIASAKDTGRTVPTNPITGKTPNYQKIEPGTFVHTPKGKVYLPPPASPATSSQVQVVQAILRGVGQRWGMPEYMTSGDVSNTPYASNLVAGSPFIRNVYRWQTFYKVRFLRTIWKAIYFAWAAGRFRKFGVSYQQLRRLIEVQCEAPTPEIANELEQAQIDQIDLTLGVMSKQTRRQRRKLDEEQESVNLKEDPVTPAAPAGGAGGAPGAAPPNPLAGMGEAVQESAKLERCVAGVKDNGKADEPWAVCRATLNEAECQCAKCRELRECGGEGGKPGPCPEQGGEVAKARPKDKTKASATPAEKVQKLKDSAVKLDAKAEAATAEVGKHAADAKRILGEMGFKSEVFDKAIEHAEKGDLHSARDWSRQAMSGLYAGGWRDQPLMKAVAGIARTTDEALTLGEQAHAKRKQAFAITHAPQIEAKKQIAHIEKAHSGTLETPEFAHLDKAVADLSGAGLKATPDHYTAVAKHAAGLSGRLAGVGGREKDVATLRTVAAHALRGARALNPAAKESLDALEAEIAECGGEGGKPGPCAEPGDTAKTNPSDHLGKLNAAADRGSKQDPPSAQQALAAYQQLPDSPQGGKVPPFPVHEGSPRALRSRQPTDAEIAAVPVSTVALKDLVATQDRVDGRAVAAYIQGRAPDGGTSGYPTVIRAGGKLYIEDGHHRLTADWTLGRTHAQVKVLDGTSLESRHAAESTWRWQTDQRLRECGGEGGKPGPCPDQGGATSAKTHPDTKPGSDHLSKLDAAADQKASGILSRVKGLIPESVRNKTAAIGAAIKGKMEARYGATWTKAIITAGAATAPIPVPGLGPATLAAMVGAAELHRAYKKVRGVEATEADKDESGHCHDDKGHWSGCDEPGAIDSGTGEPSNKATSDSTPGNASGGHEDLDAESHQYEYPDDDPVTRNLEADEPRAFLSHENVPSFVNEYTSYWEDKLSSDDRTAIDEYTRPGGYYEMNKSARECPETLDCLGEQDKWRFDQLNEAIGKAAGEFDGPVNVYRGVQLGDEDKAKLLDMAKQAHESGGEMVFPGITSMSFNPKLAAKFSGDADGVVFEVKTQRGAYVGASTSTELDEMELLHGHNTRYRVRGVLDDVLFGDGSIRRKVIQLEHVYDD